MTNQLRIVIIEDDEVLRKGYEMLLSNKEDFLIVSTYGSFDLARKQLKADAPQVILLDINMPGTNGLQAIPEIKKSLPNAYVIILTVFDSPETVFEALNMGADGYLTKNSNTEKITEAIKDVCNGGGVMSMNVARIVMQSFQKNLNSPLTKRETEILQRIATGQTKIQIANDLFIDQNTVRSHVKNIYIKLDVNSKADAIKTAKQNRFI
ncbi:MAG: response regulator transcription factor [Pedobacter sp.]|uniref:response regulator transcription factor n=1 Tax=Pedobacter sp. TaxID=1411316 RepID=UPI0028080869|nr:response regulator transcription factor [Pedobacter sp.]MDQ8006553.1 response regulator transcription factor [Pedobacter sp.]